MIVVLKVGTSTVCGPLANAAGLVDTVHLLRKMGHLVVIVSSGAVGVGMKHLGLDKRPKHLPQIQAVAAIGQGRLMAFYDGLFTHYGIKVGQVLLTRDNLAERNQYLNARNTFRELLALNVVPIVNENDTVSNAEIRFGDNDTLSAITAGMVNANYLFLMTDVDALYTDNPTRNPDAKPIRIVENISEMRNDISISTPGSSYGTGGMVTKMIAAELATAVGCGTVICLGSHPEKVPIILQELEEYQKTGKIPSMGTFFVPKANPMLDRKWWILHGLTPSGTLYIDDGAAQSVLQQKHSLFAVGVYKVEGSFNAQQCVSIKRKNSSNVEVEVARGLVNYNSNEIQRILKTKSHQIESILGYMETEWIIHRDNLIPLESLIS